MRFGPDVEWLPTDESNSMGMLDENSLYDVEPARSNMFYAAIRQYYPALPDNSLHADYSGIRPKLVGNSKPSADFHLKQDGRVVSGHLFDIYYFIP